MRKRLPLILSACALVVALLGTTPLGHAAGRAIHSVPPFAKTASYAKFAGNASKLNGRKSTLSGAPGTIPVVGANGKLSASLGAVGPKGDPGPKGNQGAAGPAGPAGPAGISGIQTLYAESASNSTDFKIFGLACPVGKILLGGGARVGPSPAGLALNGSYPTGNPAANGWYVTASEITPTTSDWYIDIGIICANAS